MTLANPNLKGLIFDWDNTLVNTWSLIHNALNETLVRYGHEPWSLAKVQQKCHLSARDIFPLLFKNYTQEAIDFFYKIYHHRHLELLQTMPHSLDMLTFCHQKGIDMYVVSNKNGRTLRAEIKHLKWEHFFKKAIGATDAPKDKPHSAPVELALGQRATKQYYFVGDTPVDIECALNSGCTPCALGFKNPKALHLKSLQDIQKLLGAEPNLIK